MTGEAQSPPEYRYMIRAFADILDPGNAEDIQNINTAPLPNGAHCYVISRRAVFVLNKFSTTSANGVEVLAPIAGGGRWLLESVAIAGAPTAEIYTTTDGNTFVADGTMNQPDTANFALQEGQNTNIWALTALGGILTYNGPDTPAIATLTAAVSVDNTDAQRVIMGFASHNDDDPGFAAGTTIAGVQEVVQGTVGLIQMLVAQRYIPALQAGNTIRPKFAAQAAAGGGNISSLQLIVRPL